MAILKKICGSEVMQCNDETLTLDHFISTETEDDGGDVMRADGMKLRGRPVVLKQHGMDVAHGNEPIAKPLDIRIGTNEKGAKGLIATTQFFPDETGRRLFEKAKGGFMPNWSIGYQIISATPTKSGGRDVNEWSLHEYSQVAVGMNAEATTPEYKSFSNRMFGFVVEDDPQPISPAKESPVMNVKSITDRVRGQIAYDALHTIHDAMIQEAWSKACDKSCKDDEEMIADALLDDHKACAKEHVKNMVYDMRVCAGNVCSTETEPTPEQKEAAFKEYIQSHTGMSVKSEVKPVETSHNAETETATPSAPAPVAETVTVSDTVDPATVVTIAEEAAPVTLPATEDVVLKGFSVEEVGAAIKTAVDATLKQTATEALDKLRGRLPG